MLRGFYSFNRTTYLFFLFTNGKVKSYRQSPGTFFIFGSIRYRHSGGAGYIIRTRNGLTYVTHNISAKLQSKGIINLPGATGTNSIRVKAIA